MIFVVGPLPVTFFIWKHPLGFFLEGWVASCMWKPRVWMFTENRNKSQVMVIHIWVWPVPCSRSMPSKQRRRTVFDRRPPKVEGSCVLRVLWVGCWQNTAFNMAEKCLQWVSGWRKFKNGNKKASRWSIVALRKVAWTKRTRKLCMCFFNPFYSFSISCLHLPFVFFPRRICFAKASKSNPVTLTTFGQAVANPPMMWHKRHIRGPRQQHRRHQRIWSIGINFHQCLKGPAPKFQTQVWGVTEKLEVCLSWRGGEGWWIWPLCVFFFGGEGVGNLKTKTCEVRLS